MTSVKVDPTHTQAWGLAMQELSSRLDKDDRVRAQNIISHVFKVNQLFVLRVKSSENDYTLQFTVEKSLKLRELAMLLSKNGITPVYVSVSSDLQPTVIISITQQRVAAHKRLHSTPPPPPSSLPHGAGIGPDPATEEARGAARNKVNDITEGLWDLSQRDKAHAQRVVSYGINIDPNQQRPEWGWIPSGDHYVLTAQNIAQLELGALYHRLLASDAPVQEVELFAPTPHDVPALEFTMKYTDPPLSAIPQGPPTDAPRRADSGREQSLLRDIWTRITAAGGGGDTEARRARDRDRS